jgi:heat-inducible transcriptional repressor
VAELSLRARRILQAVVQEYLSTGDAVGSRTLTRRYGIDLSPATVRNVMSDLEELGLLKQPHTSAGRVPTTVGLRLFIDSLLKVRSLSPKEREDIRARYAVLPGDFEEILQTTSRVLSEMSHQAAIVITPVPERQRLEHVEFLRLKGDQILAVLVVEGGQVENRLVRLGLPDDAGFMERVNNYLNEKVKGRTLEEVRTVVLEDLGQEKNQYDALASHALRLGLQVFGTETSPEVIVSGQAHLVDDDDGGQHRIRALLAALEEKEGIVRLLDRTLTAEGIQVWLGADSPFRDSDVSVVGAPYGPEDRPVGSIAVIGPTRMNYSRVIPLVDFTAELVSGLLAKR